MYTKNQKQALLDALYEPYKNCHACPLGFLGRKTVVFGEGSPDAKLMFIGEAPGRDEDNQGRPFVGRSGKLLSQILESLNIKREEVFITNSVKCRPPNNRPPTPLERGTCKSILLLNQIKIIKPELICTLGASALEGLLDRPVKISQLRGTLIEHNELKILPTYHPAYAIRNNKELEKLKSDIKFAQKIINHDK
jgi:uracil-DNA glycosylase